MAVGDLQFRAAHASHRTSVTPWRDARRDVVNKSLRIYVQSSRAQLTSDLKEMSSGAEVGSSLSASSSLLAVLGADSAILPGQ